MNNQNHKDNEKLPPISYHDLINRRIKFGDTDFIILEIHVKNIQGENRTKENNLLIKSEQRTLELFLRKYDNHLEIMNLFRDNDDN